MKNKTRNESSSIKGRVITRIQDRGGWLDGEVVTPHGIVSVMVQGGNSFDPLTRLDLAHKGRLHIRTIPRRLSERGVAIHAKRFAREIVG